MSKLVSRVFPCLLGLLLILSSGLQAQSVFGTITGTVTDASGSVVARANVTATNSASGDIRRSVTNSDGYYVFSSVPVGQYSITVDAPGFQKTEQTGLNLLGAETRKADFTLQVGSSKAEVTITSSADIVGTVDSGEKASVLTTKQLQDFSVVGRSAAEFIKILPGFASIGTGVQNKPGFTGEVIGINGGGEAGRQSAIGSYSANGLGAASIDITADGSHVSDPGCNCASPVNPNTDMIQEFKVMTSNFSAENSKGPVVINSVAKAGGKDFHGEAYFYARHYAMNANDYENNKLGLPKPENKYFFPGGQIGGPVLIPGTNFNKNRDKLFFFTAYEYYRQTLDTGLVTSNVPTAGERIGDFSGDLASLTSAATGGNTAAQAFIKNYPNGIIPPGSVDPTGKVLSSLYPLPNANPTQTQGFNFAKQYNLNQNSYQSLSRVDYSISDNTKLFVRYNLQNELQQFPIGLWWRNSGQVPYPTPIDGRNTSQSISASLTHVFNPTLTNEAVVGYTYINFPNTFEDPKKVDRKALGIPFTGIYHNGVAQIPSVVSWGSGIGAVFNPGGFEKGGNGTLFATKYLPSFSDTLTKVAGTHTLKFGFYWEHIINNQPANNYTNGLIVEAPWAGGSTGNTFADLILGNAAQYQETNLNPLHNEAYSVSEGFVQDSWKTSRRLTLELGLRASHLGNWYDRQGVGFSVWAPSTYTNTPTAPTNYDGVLWHARNKSVPLSGFNQKALFWAPRFGLAYDVFGTGKTVIRGGWGAFRYHTPQFTNGLDVGFGVLNYNQGSLLSFSQLQALTPTLATSGRQGLNVLDQKDSEQPLTYSWSFTISQRTFGHSLFEASYVGNSSRYLPDAGGTFNNVNAVPYGTFLGNGNVSSTAYDNARPLVNYQDLNVARNDLYSNYHSLQLSWVRQSGRWNYQVNYVYSKALGITGNADALNLNDNYGPTANDRRNVFNAAYSYELPNVVKNNAFLKGVVNGWQISGITQFSSGQNLAQNGNQNFNLQSGNYLPNFNSTYINGTNSVALHPLVTCNPSSGLKANQYINGNCFAAPTIGHNGPTVLPEVFGPAFFDSDLSMFKNFQMGEQRKLQFRMSAYNFLNHPINSFIDQNANNLTLTLGANGKNTNTAYGTTTDKFGHRTIQLAVKFYF